METDATATERRMIMRLIDANSLHRKVMMETNPYGKPTIDYDSGVKVLEWIEQASTVDAVPVVRCKDCKYRFKNNGHSRDGCPIIDANIWMDGDDFCSHGERKDNETD